MNTELFSYANRPERTISPELKSPKYSLVIFDFHGTMTDHQLRSIRAYHHTAHETLGIHLSKEFYQKALVRPSKKSDQHVKNREFIESEFSETFEPHEVEEFQRRFAWYLQNTYIPIPNMPQTIKSLIRDGIDIRLLTNGSNINIIRETLQKWELGELSKNLYSSHVTGVKKPNIRTVQHILDDYEKKGITIPNNRVLMVGDYIDDTTTASALGVDSVLMVRGNGWETFKIKEPKPTYIISNPPDLIKIVRGEFTQQLGDTFDIQPSLWPKENWGPKNL